MDVKDARHQFLEAWGKLGSNWGINRTMAQIHALLLLSDEPLSAEAVMEELQISRGNANMNLRALIDWQLVEKKLKPGERREFFEAEKDIWVVAQRVMLQRKKRELEPLVRILQELSTQEAGKNKEMKEFQESISPIRVFAEQADTLLEKVGNSKSSAYMAKFLSLFK